VDILINYGLDAVLVALCGKQQLNHAALVGEVVSLAEPRTALLSIQ